MGESKNFIKIGSKSYPYTISGGGSNETNLFVCTSANINQEFLKEDIVDLIQDLPNLIKVEEEYKAKQDQVIRFRISSIDKLRIKEQAEKEGFSNISSYIKKKILN